MWFVPVCILNRDSFRNNSRSGKRRRHFYSRNRAGKLWIVAVCFLSEYWCYNYECNCIATGFTFIPFRKSTIVRQCHRFHVSLTQSLTWHVLFMTLSKICLFSFSLRRSATSDSQYSSNQPDEFILTLLWDKKKFSKHSFYCLDFSTDQSTSRTYPYRKPPQNLMYNGKSALKVIFRSCYWARLCVYVVVGFLR